MKNRRDRNPVTSDPVVDAIGEAREGSLASITGGDRVAIGMGRDDSEHPLQLGNEIDPQAGPLPLVPPGRFVGLVLRGGPQDNGQGFIGNPTGTGCPP
jgi:hypothetical protein